MNDRISVAVAGDAMIEREVSVREDTPLERLVGEIRDADVSVVNLESTVHDYEGYPRANAGMYMRSPPRALDDLTWMGFDAVTAANNHVGDFSHSGMLATMEHLEERSIPYAGLGRCLSDARRPAYFDTPVGRVAVVAVCSTFPEWTAAGPHGPTAGGRPGLAPLSVSGHYTAPEDDVDTLRELSDNLGLERQKQANADRGFPHPDTDSQFTLPNRAGGDVEFRIADNHRFEWTVDTDHVEATLRRVREADRQADWVVASLHAHQGGVGHFGDDTVPSFVESFAHQCVDAGADLFAGHGPHVVRGAEVYDGSPIFYGLGDFVLHEESVTRLPAEMYEGSDPEATPADVFDEREPWLFAEDAFWHSVVPVCEFEDERVTSVQLYPVDLQPSRARSRRGTPVLASGDRAHEILSRFADLAAEYGTTVHVDEQSARFELPHPPGTDN